MPTISTYDDNTSITDDGAQTAANKVTMASIKTDLTDPLKDWIENNAFELGADVASASSLGVNIDGTIHDVTGATTITNLATATGTTPKVKILQFDGALTVEHSSAIVLPAAANITTQAGDVGIFYQVGNGNWKCVAFTGERGHFATGTTVGPLAAADGTFHVHTASAGSVTAPTSQDDLVVENSGSAGITILTPNTNTASLVFGDADDNDVGYLQYQHASNVLLFGVNASEAMRISSGQDVHIGGTSPSARLHVTDSVNAVGYIESTSAGTDGVRLALYGNSASPTDADICARLDFRGNTDDGAGGTTSTNVLYGYQQMQLDDTTDTSKDSHFEIWTTQSNTLGERLGVGAGVYTTNATGGDQGADTINASTVYQDGVGVMNSPSTSTDPALAADTWRTPNANRPTLVSVDCRPVTDGVSNGVMSAQVDEGGGTTADYTLTIATAHSSFGDGGLDQASLTFIVPAGGSYRIANTVDPKGTNLINDHREFTL